ncbi:MAG: hypothetical protein GAK43_00007 [Stenotrophomonas maltophilia]|nr:MAG: hypothetical protein GAK43_00007 [Stenotrophomonas maltophilia]
MHAQLQLSVGASPREAAHWLDGFLNRNATVLLHDDAVWQNEGGVEEKQLARA